LTLAREIDGMPAEDFLANAAPVFGDYQAYMDSHPSPFGP
jgi:hypothetical protein